jgi:repressor LexA
MPSQRSQELTPRQHEILRFIQDYTRTRRVPPTVREIGEHFGIWIAAVARHIEALERKGRLRRAARGSRLIELLPVGKRAEEDQRAGLSVPIVGRVAAGQPLLAEERIEDYLVVEDRLASRAPLFALRVQGRSMTGAGILDGDYVIARQQSTADDGDIVVALIGEEATVKRLRRRRGAWHLDPEHPDFEPIPVTEPTMIQGKVVSVYRRVG